MRHISCLFFMELKVLVPFVKNYIKQSPNPGRGVNKVEEEKREQAVRQTNNFWALGLNNWKKTNEAFKSEKKRNETKPKGQTRRTQN